jgi:tRNA A37 threonylcarbamoyladenosine modification protein TsaB
VFVITISFNKREFEVALWENSVAVQIVSSHNASKNLVLCIDQVLNKANISMNNIKKVAFLSGPGSFTSSRIVCATCLGMKLVYDNIVYVPTLVNEAIDSLPGYEDCVILMRCNTQLWHVYTKEWQLINEKDLLEMKFARWTSIDEITIEGDKIEWPNLSNAILKYSERVDMQKPIHPFYGF